MLSETRLAQLLCSRLCHDLSGSLGSLVGALDLVVPAAGSDAEPLALARDAAEVLRVRLMVMRALAGSGPGDGEGIARLLVPALAERRTQLESTMDKDLVLAPEASAMLVAAAMLGLEALPRGGVLYLSGGAEGLRIVPEGRNATWPPSLELALAGQAMPSDATARQVLAPWLAALAAEAGWRAELEAGTGGQAAPALHLAPRPR